MNESNDTRERKEDTPTLSIIPLKVKGLNGPIKRERLSEWSKIHPSTGISHRYHGFSCRPPQ